MTEDIEKMIRGGISAMEKAVASISKGKELERGFKKLLADIEKSRREIDQAIKKMVG